MNKGLMNLLWMTLTLVGAYLAVAGTIWGMQRQLIYVASEKIGYPEQYQLAMEERAILTRDNVSLQTWWAKPEEGMPTVIYFPGNSGNLADRTLMFKALIKEGFGVFAINYRGYGKSTGKPSEEGLYTDARTAIQYVQEELGVLPQSIILYGETLGSAVAVQMATETDAKLLVLYGPFTSITKRAKELYPWLPIDWMLDDRYDSIRKIRDVKPPLLIMHGALDDTVPPQHGERLFNWAKEFKQFVLVPRADANNYVPAHLIQNMVNFYDDYLDFIILFDDTLEDVWDERGYE